MTPVDKRPSRLVALPLAIAFLFETWVWRKLVAVAALLASLLPWVRFRDWARQEINGAPALLAILLFGIPLAVSEFGAFFSVVMMATGQVFAGMALYVAMRIFGLFLVPVIFEITREKLLSLVWFAYLYRKFEALHAMASRFVAPYRQAALERAREIAAAGWRAVNTMFQRRSAAKARAAKAATVTSSARTVASSPASPSH